jgi:hypothetical protein
VIDHGIYRGDEVVVRNVGCPPGASPEVPETPCTSPGQVTTVEITDGGEVLDLRVYDSSTVRMSGGSVAGSLEAFGSSSIAMLGGSVGEVLSARDASTIVIVGANFMVDGRPVPYGDLGALTGTLTGILAFGSSIDNVFFQDFTGAIRLLPARFSAGSTAVPEPATGLLLGAGLAALSAARWRHSLDRAR